MMTRPAGLAVLLLLGLGGCASTTERVVLLPGADGKVGKVMVTHGRRKALLDTAYGAATVDSGGGMQKAVLDRESVQRDFGSVLQALPPRPQSYTFFFEENSNELTPESRQKAPAILAEIAKRPAAEMVVTGHTDRNGPLEYNDRLSLTRAEAVRKQLVSHGVDSVRIKVESRGEREPAVPTDDGVIEPRNRRVEVSVR